MHFWLSGMIQMFLLVCCWTGRREERAAWFWHECYHPSSQNIPHISTGLLGAGLQPLSPDLAPVDHLEVRGESWVIDQASNPNTSLWKLSLQCTQTVATFTLQPQ